MAEDNTTLNVLRSRGYKLAYSGDNGTCGACVFKGIGGKSFDKCPFIRCCGINHYFYADGAVQEIDNVFLTDMKTVESIARSHK